MIELNRARNVDADSGSSGLQVAHTCYADYGASIESDLGQEEKKKRRENCDNSNFRIGQRTTKVSRKIFFRSSNPF